MTASGEISEKPQSIRRLLVRSIAAVALIFGVLALLPKERVRHEGIVPGPEFRAVSTMEAAEVWSGLHHALESRDLELDPPLAGELPPEPVNGAGEEERQTRYIKHLPGTGTLKVDAVLSGVHIRTSVKWEVLTPDGNPRAINALAAGSAVAIDEYFRNRMEPNLVPKEDRESRTEFLRKEGGQSR